MKIKSELCDKKLFHTIRINNGMEFVVAVRKGAIDLLKHLSLFYNIYIFSFIGRDLLNEIIDKILDPDGTIILKRDYNIHRSKCRIWTYSFPMLKNPCDILR